MSRHIALPDDGRFDSYLDMSQSNHCDAHEDYEDTQVVAASSLVEPWSEYNTRLESDHPSSPYAGLDWSAYNHSPDHAACIDHSMPAFDASFEPVMRFASPDPLIFSTYAPSASSSLPTPLMTTPSTASVATRLDRHDGILQCSDCGQDFTGTYRSGNLARHRKQKHLDLKAGLYLCTFQGCSSVFNRSDARLKHSRIKHPGLRLPPAQRRQGTEYVPSSLSANHDNAIEKTLEPDIDMVNDMPDYLPRGSAIGELESLVAPARYIISILESKLGPVELSHVYDSFFTRWESVVDQMFNDKSDAYSVYAQVLDDIRLIVHAPDHTGHGSQTRSDPQSSRSNSNKQARSRGNDMDSIGRSQSDRVTKRGSWSGGAGKSLLDTVDTRVRVDGRQEVDCPVYKYHVMHGLLPPCRGCRVTVMSQVRSHLNPDRASGTHRGFPRFVEQCSRCKQDFIDRQRYDAHKAANTCAFERQIRGDILLPWARQYLTLYPNARRVPLPWPSARGWIQDSLLAPLRNSRSSNTRSIAFLDERRDLSSPQIPNSRITTASDAQYTGALGRVLHDLVNPTYTQSAYSSAPAPNERRDYTADIESPFTGGTGSNNAYWQSILHSLESHQRAIREAAPHLTSQQLGYMAMQSGHVFSISRGLYQQQQRSQVMQDRATPAIREDRPMTRASNTIVQSFGTSSYPQTPTHVQSTTRFTVSGAGQASSSTDRSRSNRSYAARSSERPDSSLTHASSSYSPHNPNLLSPYSPLDYRRTSLPSNVRPDAPRMSRALPSRRSLPDDPDDCIDPSLLNSPPDDDSLDSIDYRIFPPRNGY